MVLELNGEATEIPAEATVPDLLAILGFESPRGVAVAADGEVVPRSEWSRFQLRDGMRVEVLRPVQGG